MNEGASIVFISSISAHHPYTGGALYSVSKSGLEAFSRSFAHENANKKIDPIIQEINQFYQTEWPAYQKLVESSNLSPFKKYEPLK